jgi:hypothetical protein
MHTAILQDALQRPELFRWNGPIPRDDVRRWIHTHLARIPLDLLDTWVEFGGGELFESEILLAPTDGVDGINSRTEHLRARGLADGLLAIHEGSFITAIAASSGELIALDWATLRETARFATLDNWYELTIRAEFAERYGLSALSD